MSRWFSISLDSSIKHIQICGNSVRWISNRTCRYLGGHPIPEAPWFTVKADDKKRARLNCVYHILSKIPYVDMTPQPLELSPRKSAWNLRLKMLLPLPSSDCRGRNLLMSA
ncbi:hypothetical protein [Nostoc spongiaeforme]|uniref:hypothetical protein n=1 Tax=Nostoc spongiaeforme TaxID=502487 RepID=UPI0036F1EF88